MARRSKPYIIELAAGQVFKLSASEWDELLSGGWIVETGFKTARPKSGVIAWVRGGNLSVFAFVRLRTASWARAWLFKVGIIRASAIGEAWDQRRERVMRDLDRDLQNEALLWRTFRDRRTKGANSFSWIASDHKIEILRALRPELV